MEKIFNRIPHSGGAAGAWLDTMWPRSSSWKRVECPLDGWVETEDAMSVWASESGFVQGLVRLYPEPEESFKKQTAVQSSRPNDFLKF